jgi:hypothetical protein
MSFIIPFILDTPNRKNETKHCVRVVCSLNLAKEKDINSFLTKKIE